MSERTDIIVIDTAVQPLASAALRNGAASRVPQRMTMLRAGSDETHVPHRMTMTRRTPA